MEHQWGWRGACLGWAVLHLAVGFPLNAWVFRTPSGLPTLAPKTDVSVVTARRGGTIDRPMLILAFMFTASGIVSYGVAANLPGLFSALGATPLTAIAAASFLMGPARVVLHGSLSSAHAAGAIPWWEPEFANALHPLGAAVLGFRGRTRARALLDHSRRR